MNKLLAAICGLAFCVASRGADQPLPYFDSRELTPYWKSDAGAAAFSPTTVGAFKVIDQNAASVNEKFLEKKISLVNFFFAECPSLCPLMMRSIQRAQGRLGALANDVQIYSFSVKPADDSPAVLRAYAKTRGIDLTHWTLLTGNREEIYRIGKGVFKADGSVGAQKSETSFIHNRNVYLVDRQRRIRGIYDTENTQAMDLIALDVARLKREESAQPFPTPLR
jgi:protein SCO1/2